MLPRARTSTLGASLLALASLAACAASGSGDDAIDDASADSGASAPAGDAAPSVYDAGAPANPYGDAGGGGAPDPDGGTDAAAGGGGPCQTAADCPGAGKPNDTVTCLSHACALSCVGEHYDVNGDPADGCEVADSPIANHRAADAIDVGTFSCVDGSSAQNLDGMIPSDARVHDGPSIAGFDSITGSAPDFYVIHASGGICDDDVNLALAVSGSRAPGCYRLTVNTDKNGGQICQTDATGHCSITNGTGSYSDGSDIQVVVQKTCGASTTETAVFAVTGHL